MSGDTAHSQYITDHYFEPRTQPSPVIMRGTVATGEPRCFLQPNEHLCGICRMAEAAHQHTTRKEAPRGE